MPSFSWLARQCAYEFTQATDARGRAAAKVRHGLVRLTLDVPDDAKLLDWAATPRKPLAGHVTFYDAKEVRTLRRVRPRLVPPQSGNRWFEICTRVWIRQASRH